MTEPFLIGENMTGGYGGADILKGCTISVSKGEIAVIVMAEGAVLVEGTAEEVKSDERVIEAYLGTGLKNKAEAIA